MNKKLSTGARRGRLDILLGGVASTALILGRLRFRRRCRNSSARRPRRNCRKSP